MKSWLLLGALLGGCSATTGNGFTRGCWLPAGVYHSGETVSACQGRLVVAPTWRQDQLPLRVSDQTREFWPEIEEAVAFWNQQAGQQIFRFTSGEADISLRDDLHCLDNRLATTVHFIRDGRHQARVTLCPALHDVFRPELIIKHELGHVLGLAHDEEKTSLMYHSYRNGVHLSRHDHDLIHKRYGRPNSSR